MKRDFWDSMAKNYDSTINKVYAEANKKVITKAAKYCNKDLSLLDVGCGTGLLTMKLARLVKSVDAIDLSVQMLDIAKKNANESNINNISWKQENLLEVDDKYNIITAFNILLYIDNPDKFILECYKHLFEEGYLIIVTDCLAQVNVVKRLLYSTGILVGKLGLFPMYRMFKTEEVENMIMNRQFQIIEKENVYTTPPNYLVIAKKKAC